MVLLLKRSSRLKLTLISVAEFTMEYVDDWDAERDGQEWP
jgi:hypothetical protein